MQENVDREQISFFRELTAHADNRFDSRLNFFLIFESVLLGVVGVLYSKSSSINPVLVVIVLLGLLLTILWGYIQRREKFLFDVAFAKLQEIAPEYREFVNRREQQVKWLIHSTLLLTYGIPLLIALVWIMLLILVLLV